MWSRAAPKEQPMHISRLLSSSALHSPAAGVTLSTCQGTYFHLNTYSSWVPELVRDCKMSWVPMIQPIFKNASIVREGLTVSIMLWTEGKDMTCRSLQKPILMVWKGEWIGQPLGSLQTVFQVLWQQLMSCSLSVSQGLSLMGTWWSSLPSSQWTPSVLGRVTSWSS